MCLTGHVISLGHVNIYRLLKSIRHRLICHNSFVLSLLFSLVFSLSVVDLTLFFDWPCASLSLASNCVPVHESSLLIARLALIVSVYQCYSCLCSLLLFFCSFSLFSILCFFVFLFFLKKIRKWKGVTWRVGCNLTCRYDSFLVRNWVGRMRRLQLSVVGVNFKG